VVSVGQPASTSSVCDIAWGLATVSHTPAWLRIIDKPRGRAVARSRAGRSRLPHQAEVWTYNHRSITSRASYGAPQWQLDAWVSSYTAIANGELEMVSDAVARLTGRPPLSLATVLGGIG
jgi:hypothetical protein